MTLTWPSVMVCAVVEVLRRMLQFAFDKPAREVLYTPLDPDGKYVSKAVIDTAVMRTGDLLGAVLNSLLKAAQFQNAALLAVALPVIGVWMWIGRWLGRAYDQRERSQREPIS
jgi:AAA family ATP:ADP antiporter